MKFQIDFNYGSNDALLELLGATEHHYEDHSDYEIDLDSFESLEMLLESLDRETKDIWSAVISFDPSTIYLDNKV